MSTKIYEKERSLLVFRGPGEAYSIDQYDRFSPVELKHFNSSRLELISQLLELFESSTMLEVDQQQSTFYGSPAPKLAEMIANRQPETAGSWADRLSGYVELYPDCLRSCFLTGTTKVVVCETGKLEQVTDALRIEYSAIENRLFVWNHSDVWLPVGEGCQVNEHANANADRLENLFLGIAGIGYRLSNGYEDPEFLRAGYRHYVRRSKLMKVFPQDHQSHRTFCWENRPEPV